MRKIFLLLVMLLFIVSLSFLSCRGPITGHEYTRDEISRILNFAAQSLQHIEKYQNGNFTEEDLAITEKRLEDALNYIKQLKRDYKNKHKEE